MTPLPATPVVEALLESGELVLEGRGGVGLAGRPLRVRTAFDALFRGWALDLGAREWHFPPLISREVLERADFFAAFPHLATYVSGPPGDEPPREPPAHLLATAVCYHLYPHLTANVLPVASGPLVLTAAGECYRFEETDTLQPLTRQWAFQMREIVFVGAATRVRQAVEELTVRTQRLAREQLQLAAELVVASDPFFEPTARGKALLQRVKSLKHELRVPLEDGSGLAIASFNLHEDFFGRAFDIRLDDGQVAHSACVAFGLERWVHALFSRHGLDASL